MNVQNVMQQLITLGVASFLPSVCVGLCLQVCKETVGKIDTAGNAALESIAGVYLLLWAP